uniref:60S ribosomal protein L18a n=1 Tax=Panagrellus redivivus TaxID=6233 RepID=A0A7E4VHG8_PANRE
MRPIFVKWREYGLRSTQQCTFKARPNPQHHARKNAKTLALKKGKPYFCRFIIAKDTSFVKSKLNQGAPPGPKKLTICSA